MARAVATPGGPLLTPKQAERIAEEVLDPQRREEADAKNAVAQKVPFIHYVRGLNSLEPWERTQIAQCAVRDVGNHWKSVLYLMSLVGLCCAAWWSGGLFSRPGVSPMFLVVLCGVVVAVARAHLVRQELRRSLLERSASAPE